MAVAAPAHVTVQPSQHQGHGRRYPFCIQTRRGRRRGVKRLARGHTAFEGQGQALSRWTVSSRTSGPCTTWDTPRFLYLSFHCSPKPLRTQLMSSVQMATAKQGSLESGHLIASSQPCWTRSFSPMSVNDLRLFCIVFRGSRERSDGRLQ